MRGDRCPRGYDNGFAPEVCERGGGRGREGLPEGQGRHAGVPIFAQAAQDDQAQAQRSDTALQPGSQQHHTDRGQKLQIQ